MNYNIHALHLEDVVTTGIHGTSRVIEAIKAISETTDELSIKWDGAPAVVVGYHKDRFFVSTKSYFNKTPVMYFDESQIKDKSPELTRILSMCFQLKECIPQGKVFQGDVLFCGDLDLNIVEGKSYITCHPNTIVYGVEADSALGKKWKNSQLGIAIHTEINNGYLKPANLEEFQETDHVWICDVKLTKTKIDLTEHITKLEEITKGIWDISLAELSECSDDYKKHMNSYIIANAEYQDVVNSFYESIDKKWATHITSLKSDAGRLIAESRKQDQLQNLPNPSQLEVINNFYQQVVEVKRDILKECQTTDVKCFLKTINGLQETSHEGVIYDRQGFKIINRREFSHANFSDYYIKGWQ